MHKATAITAAALIAAPCAVSATIVGTSTATAQAGTPSTTAYVEAPLATARAERPRYRHVTLPTRPCATEDAAGPCVWDAGLRGNGEGASFWRDRRDRVHYLDYEWDWEAGWHPRYSRCHYDSSQPEPRVCQYPFTYFRGWKRVSSPMSDALAEGEYGTERDWTRCIEHVGDTTYIVCPDGFEIVP